MNYALDALWWKLTDPKVRDLASLLTAPPLWLHPNELSPRTLLGEHGFRYLLTLDETPHILAEHLACRPASSRLGHYAEELLAFWFAHAPHSVLYAHNLPVASDGRTRGAADFIASLDGTPYHIELTCKYYGSTSPNPATLCGLNPEDKLTGKAVKLQQQLKLFASSDGINTLHRHGYPVKLTPAVIIRGNAFFPDPDTPALAPLNPYCWRGRHISDWSQYPFANPAERYYPIQRTDFLAPARIAESATIDAQAVRYINSGIIAAVEPRPDGYWHETARIMKTAQAV